jgi:Raf kinase inhibitor-like YbhB/YbcL family protein
MLRLVTLSLLFASPALAGMTLEMPGLKDGTLPDNQVLQGFGCEGLNLSPELVWSGAPAETGSFVITAYDPDAPTGSGLWHWSAFNIPASVARLSEAAASPGGTVPDGMIQARNDFSQNRYDGACPPEGSTHRYVFTVYAMPMAALPLDSTASAAMVGFFANTGSLARASVTVTYGR